MMGMRVSRIAFLVAAMWVSFAAAGATTAGDVSVRVRVWTQRGLPASNAYVALVPVWRPWSAPLVEGIAENGSRTFHVPKGVYHFVAGARGFQVSTEGPFFFNDDAGGSVETELKPLRQVSGIVRDEDGKTLAGVRVAESGAAIVPPFGTLSELAVGHLAPDWFTLTDKAGKWSLGMPDGVVPTFFTAEGRAPQWRFCKVGDPAALSVSMSRGAALRVTFDRTDPGLIMTLEREGPDPAGGVPHDWQRQIWVQRTTKTALNWRSLSAGVYSIYVKYPQPSFFMNHAKKVGTVTLTTAKVSHAEVTLPGPVRQAQRIARLFVEGAPARELKNDEIEAFALDSGGDVRRVSCVTQQVIGGSVLYLNAEGARLPFYAATPDQFVAADLDIADLRADSNRTPARAAVYRRADAYAVLLPAEKDLQLPRTGMAVLRNCSRMKSITVPVPIGKGNIARFTGAAGCGAGVLSFTPFEPVLLTKPLQQGDQSLGDFVLHAAASADVRVVRDPEHEVVPGAIVRVVARDDTPPSSPDAQWIQVAEAQSGPDGWTHLDSVPVLRDLHFVAQAPSGELSVPADARAEPRGRLVIDPLAIPKPATLIVAPKLKDSVRSIFPGARVTHVLIEPADPRRAEGEKQQYELLPKDSFARFEPLKPGKWIITALVNVAGADAFLKVDEVDLKAGETRRIEADLEPLVFRGRVTMGGKGVAAHVTLQNRSTSDLARHYFKSLQDGSFNTALPNSGTYSADVARVDAQGDHIPAGEVEFSDPARLVEIAIPDTATVVVHVRAEEKPVSNALVWSAHLSETAGLVDQSKRGRSTGSQGDVKFEHVLPGDWTFSVRDEASGRGAEKTLSVHESETAEVTLDIKGTGGITGTVRDAAGNGVFNAQIDCLVIGETGVPSRLKTRTESDGRFSVGAFSKLSAPALCSVTTPPGVVDGFKAMAGEAVNIQLPIATGALRISDWGKFSNPDTFWLTAPGGRAISLSAVAGAVTRSGVELHIAAVAAGRWRVIRIGSISQWMAFAAGQFSELPAVADLALGTGTTQTIQIYEKPAGQGGAN
jgi:hypothetical protein